MRPDILFLGKKPITSIRLTVSSRSYKNKRFIASEAFKFLLATNLREQFVAFSLVAAELRKCIISPQVKTRNKIAQGGICESSTLCNAMEVLDLKLL